MLKLIAVDYPKTPAFVAEGDADQLIKAMTKVYPGCRFERLTRPGGMVEVCVVGALDGQLISMTCFAEGFMASAHLWER